MSKLEFGLRPDGHMTFKVGVQSFTLDYQPESATEFDFMSRMLAGAVAALAPVSTARPGESDPAGYCQFCGRQACAEGCRASQGESSGLLAQLQKELDRIKRLAACGSVTSWTALSEEKRREWFAGSLVRDSAQVARIRRLEDHLQAVVDAVEAVPYAQRSARLQAVMMAAKVELPD